MQRFQNYISFNVENIKQKQNLCIARSRISVLKELTHSAVTLTNDKNYNCVCPKSYPNFNKVLLTLSFQKFLQLSTNFDLLSWIYMYIYVQPKICLWFALVSTWHFFEKCVLHAHFYWKFSIFDVFYNSVKFLVKILGKRSFLKGLKKMAET